MVGSTFTKKTPNSDSAHKNPKTCAAAPSFGLLLFIFSHLLHLQNKKYIVVIFLCCNAPWRQGCNNAMKNIPQVYMYMHGHVYVLCTTENKYTSMYVCIYRKLINLFTYTHAFRFGCQVAWECAQGYGLSEPPPDQAATACS